MFELRIPSVVYIAIFSCIVVATLPFVASAGAHGGIGHAPADQQPRLRRFSE